MGIKRKEEQRELHPAPKTIVVVVHLTPTLVRLHARTVPVVSQVPCECVCVVVW